MSYCVYCHTNKSNGKRYFGITCQNPLRRWNNGKGYAKNEYFTRAITKYGWDGFSHEIIKDGLSKSEACEMEIMLIAESKSKDTNFGYNIGSGGEYGSLGSVRTKEQNEAKSKQMKEVMNKKEITEKISKKREGIVFSPEHIENLRKSHIGISPSNKGVPMSEERKQKLRYKKAEKRKPVICIDNNEKYESVYDAQIKTGVNSGNISLVCQGKRNSAGGLRWKFAT